MKVCTKCGKEKDIEEFAFRNKAKNTRKANCKACDAAYHKQTYGEARKELIKGHMRKRIKEKKGWLREYKKTLKCEKCGEDRWYLLDFHHIDSNEKEGNIGELAGLDFSIERIKSEIAKCTVLCANCHREYHFLNGYGNPNGDPLH